MTDEGSAPPSESESAPAAEAPVQEVAPVETSEPAPSEAVVEASPEPVEAPETAHEPSPAASASSPPPAPAKSPPKGHMLQVVRARKQERLEKIIALARERKVITNDDVEKLLKVSDSTAARYFSELVKSGRLKRSGVRKHEQYEPL